MIESGLLERLTYALMPRLRLWDGWKVRIPINVVGVPSAVRKHLDANLGEYQLEVGVIGKNKVNTTILCSNYWGPPNSELLEDSFKMTARDGDVAVLAPMIWKTSTFARDPQAVGTPIERRTLPQVFVAPEKARASDGSMLTGRVAWFVWARDRTPLEEQLNAVQGMVAQMIAKGTR